MKFEWDDAKAATNLRNHGIPFVLATKVFQDGYRKEELDESGPYDEERWMTTGLAQGEELVGVYTWRGANIRIISARGAEVYERRDYWEHRLL